MKRSQPDSSKYLKPWPVVAVGRSVAVSESKKRQNAWDEDEFDKAVVLQRDQNRYPSGGLPRRITPVVVARAGRFGHGIFKKNRITSKPAKIESNMAIPKIFANHYIFLV
jgi:hypothetical protein